MQVINLNKNGDVIPDLSKVKLPKELNDLVWRMLNRSVLNEPTQNDSEQQQH